MYALGCLLYSSPHFCAPCILRGATFHLSATKLDYALSFTAGRAIINSPFILPNSYNCFRFAFCQKAIVQHVSVARTQFNHVNLTLYHDADKLIRPPFHYRAANVLHPAFCREVTFLSSLAIRHNASHKLLPLAFSAKQRLHTNLPLLFHSKTRNAQFFYEKV